VSRVSPVHTVLRNCTRDEGRSFEVGNQVLISSHRKLLLSAPVYAVTLDNSSSHVLLAANGESSNTIRQCLSSRRSRMPRSRA
jgi:hypothetical protein